MKSMKWLGILLLVAMVLPMLADAVEVRRNFHAVSRLRVEYDDNIYQTEDDTKSSGKFIADVDFTFDVNREQMFLSLRYMPIFIFWEDRENDDTDLNHAFDGTFKYDFTPRTSVRIKDTFRLSQDTYVNPRQTSTAVNNDYAFNSLDGTLSYLLHESTRLSLAGRWITLAYEEDASRTLSDGTVLTASQDYDIYVGGLTLRQSLRPNTGLLVDFRYQSVEYDQAERDYESVFAGLGLEHVFGPTVLGSIRGGGQYVDYAEAARGDDTNPYGDLSLTWLPTPKLRLSLVGSYSIDESTLLPYSSQERARVGLSLGYDITAKISLYVAGAYTESQYDAETSPVPSEVEGQQVVPDASENWGTVSTRLTYQLTRRNWLEISYRHIDLDSDVQRGYSRNQGGLGWVFKF